MSVKPQISALFLDVGGVLMTNGWDRHSRRRAAQRFQLDYDEMEERHNLTFGTYEEGKLSLEEYLRRTVFYQPRQFTMDDFRQFMFAQSRPYPEMIDLVRELKAEYGLRVGVVSNEGEELAVYRIHKFGLTEFVEFFIFSCFVHFRKPDEDIYRIALNVAQVAPNRVAYLEDRAMFVEVASKLGMQGIRHVDYPTTRSALAARGLALSEPARKR